MRLIKFCKDVVLFFSFLFSLWETQGRDSLPLSFTIIHYCHNQFLHPKHYDTMFFAPMILIWLWEGGFFVCLFVFFFFFGSVWNGGFGELVRCWGEAIRLESRPRTLAITTSDRWIWRRWAHGGCLVREKIGFGILMSNDCV